VRGPGLRYPAPPLPPNQEIALQRFRFLIVLATALTAAVAIAACGGDDGGGGDEDPQQVLDATFASGQTVDSGVFDVSLEVNAEGGDQGGTLDASIGGPFQSEEGAVPQFDVDAEANLEAEGDGQDFSGSAGLTSTGEAAFVNFQDTDYEVPADAFSQFSSTFTQLQDQSEQQADAEGGALGALGIDPSNWLTDLTNEGDEDVEGTETVHISGSADVPELVGDLRSIAEKAPQAAGQQITPEQLSQLDALTGIVESADIDVYSGKDDDILRKLEANLVLKPPAAEGSPESVDVTFAITLSEVNEPQEIAAPADAKPLNELLGQFGLDSSALGSALGSAGAAAPVTPDAGGSPAGPADDAAAAYLECLGNAQGEAALQQCEALLQ
jgi:hypothetical protein